MEIKDLGKLLPMTVFDATCDSKFDELYFRGDPGSVWLAQCPMNCADHEGAIWGSGVYTHDSVICKAAIHAGVIHDTGIIIIYFF